VMVFLLNTKSRSFHILENGIANGIGSIVFRRTGGEIPARCVSSNLNQEKEFVHSLVIEVLLFFLYFLRLVRHFYTSTVVQINKIV